MNKYISKYKNTKKKLNYKKKRENNPLFFNIIKLKYYYSTRLLPKILSSFSARVTFPQFSLTLYVFPSTSNSVSPSSFALVTAAPNAFPSSTSSSSSMSSFVSLPLPGSSQSLQSASST